MRSPLLLAAGLAILAAATTTPAASLLLDESFQPPFLANPVPAVRTLLLPDGKFLLYYGTESLADQRTGAITRHLPDGSLDKTFSFSRDYKYVRAAAPAAGGKLYIAAIRYAYGVQEAEVILRLHADGSIDDAFAAPAVGSNFGSVWAITVQTDGKVLVAGLFTSFGGNERPFLVRLLGNGEIDQQFTPPMFGGVGRGIYARPVVLADGRIVVAGNFTSVAGAANPGVVRLNSDGTLDSTFQPHGFLRQGSQPIRGLVVQPDGKVALGSRFQFGSGTQATYALLFRLNVNGSPDDTFIPAASRFTAGAVRDMLMQPDGKFVVANLNSVLRFHAEGPVDSTFQPPVLRSTVWNQQGHGGNSFTVGLLPDGRVLVGGEFTSVNPPDGAIPPDIHFAAVRLLADGTVDSTFDTPHATSYDAPPAGFVQLADRSTIVALDLFLGAKTSPAFANNVGRLLPNGTHDGSFAPAAGALPLNFVAHGIEAADDGTLFVWGRDVDNWIFFCTKLHIDGTRDPLFVFDPEIPEAYQAKAVAAGKVLLASDTDAQATLAGPLVRLNSIGTVDNSFALDPAIRNAQVKREESSQLPLRIAAGHRVLAMQPDGKVLVTYLAFDGQIHLERLHAEGLRDEAFTRSSFPATNLSTTFPQIYDPLTGVTLQPAEGVLTADFPLREAVVQADGKIVVVGQFTSFAGRPARGIIRLNADGTIDGSFAATNGAQWTRTVETASFFPFVEGIAQQNDGKLLLVGTFEAFDGTPAKGIVSLTADGSIDQSFTVPLRREQFSRMETRLRRQPDGSLLLAGPYSDPAGVERSLWRIENLGGVPIIGSATIAKALPQQPFTYQIVASGQPHTFGASGLPAGFQFDPQTGVITGTPTPEQIGTYQVALTATNAEGTSAVHLLQLTVPAPVSLQTLVSRKYHSQTPFDVPLPISGAAGVESRQPYSWDSSHTLVAAFGQPLVSIGEAALTSGSGDLTEVSIDGDRLQLRLLGVPNASTIKVTLHDVVDAAGNHSPVVELQASFLLGDTNGNGVVNSSDISQVKSLSGQAVTEANFRADVNLSGSINATDIGMVKANAGSSVQIEPVNDRRMAR